MTRPALVWKTMSLFAAILWLTACGASGPESAAPEKTATPPSPTQTTAPQQPRSTISAIPNTVITVPSQPTPFPNQPGGLRFQMREAPKGRSFFQPLGDVAWLPDGSLLMSFPQDHAFIKFAPVSYDLTMFGAQSVGGKDETVLSPGLLWVHQGLVQAVSTQKHQSLTYTPDIQVVDVYEAAGVSPIPGPEAQYLLRTDDRPAMFFRVDKKNQPQKSYSVPTLPGEHIEGRKLVFFPMADWRIYAGKQNASAVFLFNTDTTVAQIYSMDFSSFFGADPQNFATGPQLFDLHVEATTLWLLVDHRDRRDDKRSFVVSLHTLTFEVLGFWELPLDADRMDADGNHFVFAQRNKARALTYKR